MGDLLLLLIQLPLPLRLGLLGRFPLSRQLLS